MVRPDSNEIASLVEIALAEDIGTGDLTAEIIPRDQSLNAEVVSREQAILCGTDWVDQVFAQIDPETKVSWYIQDGEQIGKGQVVFTVAGKARSILTGERTALNFLQTLSGTASVSRQYADLVAHTKVKLLDTRKTIPGLRLAQKYAVACGGCYNHRFGLFDAYLIKENHIAACGSIETAIKRARELNPSIKLEVEVENLAEFHQAVDAGPDVILLDNFSLGDLTTAVASINRNMKLEASGGIENQQDVLMIAETGVDYISLGALTKNCKAVDLSMRYLPKKINGNAPAVS